MTCRQDVARVVVCVGTDHHRFDRLVAWMDQWYESRPDPTVECLVQYGASNPPRHAPGVSYLAHDELRRELEQASVVVCHGGPATIAEARRAGHLPLVVARDPTRREHVDDHQQRFARHALGVGLIGLVSTFAELDAALAATLAAGPPRRREPLEEIQATSVARVGELVESVLAAARGRRGRWPTGRGHR